MILLKWLWFLDYSLLQATYLSFSSPKPCNLKRKIIHNLVHITSPFQKSRCCNTTFFFSLEYIFLYCNDSEEYSQLSLQDSYTDVLKQSLQCLPSYSRIIMTISHLKWAHPLFAQGIFLFRQPYCSSHHT